MQLNRSQSGWTFRCGVLVEANKASSRDKEGATLLLNNTTHIFSFSNCNPQPQPWWTQVTSLEDTWPSSLWRHQRSPLRSKGTLVTSQCGRGLTVRNMHSSLSRYYLLECLLWAPVAQGYGQCLVIIRSLVPFPSSTSESVLGQDTKPQNCSWCADQHLAWQPPPSVYELL